jgi:hypothetical protein
MLHVGRIGTRDLEGLSMFHDFEGFTVFKPQANQEASLRTMLDQVIAWGGALKTLGARPA